MFHSKQDVDRHANEIFRNIKSEYQRNLKCYQIGKLYYKFKDYKSALKYLNRYILTTSNSAVAHRLLGECYLGLNSKVKAIEAFKTSLVLNGSQNDLVLKICTLLMDPDVSTVTPRATYWLERAETLFPTNPIVFQLKEHLLKSNLEGKQDMEQMEKLILSEISARPADVSVRIRLLNFFLDTKRYKVAYQHALEIEERNKFSNDAGWYDCLCNVVQAYEKVNTDVDLCFLMKKIYFLEKRADLFMQEFHEEVKKLSECGSALFAFDQSLDSFSKIEPREEDKYFFSEFLKHMQAQLSFHLATLLLKRAKKEYGMWSKAFRSASPLLLQATQTTMELNKALYSVWPAKSKMEKLVGQITKCATFRLSQAGHVLLAWSQSKGSKFLEKVSQFCGGKWQTHVYQDVFYNKEHQQAIGTSHFANHPFFSYVPMRLLSETDLISFDEASQFVKPDSLHHSVWLGLSYCNANGYLNRSFRCTTAPDLQFSVANLSQAGPETLNQLDVDAFLYASVLCAKSSISGTAANTDRPSRLPVSISEELCSPAQADWWVSVFKTYNNEVSENIADTRLKLRKGIEVMRVIGQHGLHPKMLVALAKLFQERAENNKNPNEITALEDRAFIYWNAAIPLLEKLEKNQQLREAPNRLFNYRGKEPSVSEIKTYLEDGRLFLARRLMKQGQHEQAIEAFQSLRSPYATYYQALIYEELASEEVNHRPESITSENRSQHIILLTRARDALYLTLDRLRCPSADPNHPLNVQLQDHLDQIERQLAKLNLDCNLKNCDSQSDETDTGQGPHGSDVDEALENSFNIYNSSSNFLNVKNQSSVKSSRQILKAKRSISRFEARPSPERLDAQLRHLVQANSSGLQAIVEQLKEMKSTMEMELSHVKDLSCVTRDILLEMKRWNDRLEASSRRADILKPEDLFELREEDYEDLNQLSQPYTPYPNYQVNRRITGTHGTSTVTYGTPVPSPIPPIPPVPPVPPIIPPSENPIIPPAFYPGPHSVPAFDPLLFYQSLGYYPPGVPYGESQTANEYRGTGIQKGAPFAKNAYKVPPPETAVAAPAPAPATTPTPTPTPATKVQPPNVVITSSDTLPAFTSTSTPAMSVTIPPQHIRGLAPPTLTQKSTPTQVHPFQIQMPPQAQLIKESPSERLNSLTQITSVSGDPSQGFVANTEQVTPNSKGMFSAKSEATEDKSSEGKLCVEGKKPEESLLFSSVAKLSCFDKEWSEKENVYVKIVIDEKSEKAKITIQKGFLTYADYYITGDMKIKALAQKENGWQISGGNSHKSDSKRFGGKGMGGGVGVGVETKSKLGEFRLYFSNLDESKDFEFAFNEGRKKSGEFDESPENESVTSTDAKAKECKTCKGKTDGSSDKCSSCLNKEKLTDKVNLGGFTFSSAPIIKDPVMKLNEEKEKPKETAKPSPFSALSFSSNPVAANKTDTRPKDGGPLPFASYNNTSTENFFAGVKPDPNSFKQDANFKGFEGKGALIFGYLNKKQTNDSEETKNKGDDRGEDDFVPTAEFTPLVELPDLVDVKTGEENDVVLFDERAKLLRFDKGNKEWKERGIGMMRVLLNEETGKVRLIMRRELVLKVCCNHYLDESIEFKRMQQSEKALTWCAQDYSEGTLKVELFALKFADKDSRARFEAAVKKAQSEMKDGRMKGAKKKDSVEGGKELKPLSELFKPKAGTWECEACLIRNEEKAKKCVSCETPKPGTQPESKLGNGISLGTGFTKFTFAMPQTTTSASPFHSTAGFSFSSSPSATAVTKVTTTKSEAPSAIPAAKFQFGIPQSTPNPLPPADNTSAASGFTFGIKNVFPIPPPSTAPPSNPLLQTPASFAAANALPAPTSNAVFGANLSSGIFTSTAPTFSFSNISSTPTTATSFSPILSLSSNSHKAAADSSSKGTLPDSALKLEGKEKFEFSMGNIKLSIPEPPKGKESAEGNASEESGAEEDADDSREVEEDNVVVKPLIPLPDKVAPHTGEEDEHVLYEQRAKLFRFVDKEWKDRGIGVVKILRHKEDKRVRILMRRDTILKVCLNHYLTPDIEFNAKDDKSWTWSAADYAEGEVQCTVFAIRFKTAEIAQEFRKVIDNSQKEVSPDDNKPEKPKEVSAAMKNFTFTVPNATKSDEVLVLYENKVTPDLRDKAISLQLPPNFYAYLQAPDCPGCPGCDKEDTPPHTQPQKTHTPPTTKPSLFESKPWGSLNFGGNDNSKKEVLFTFAGNQGKPFWNPGSTALNLTRTTEKKENKDEEEEEGGGEDDDDHEEGEDDENDVEDEDDDEDYEGEENYEDEENYEIGEEEDEEEEEEEEKEGEEN